MTDYIKRSIEMHPDLIALLDDLQSHHRLRTHTQVIQKAIQLLAVFKGKKVYIERDNGNLQEVVISGESNGEAE
jgi:hypothetical protein